MKTRSTRLFACVALVAAFAVSAVAQVSSVIARGTGKVEVDASSNVLFKPGAGKSLILFDTCPSAPLSTSGRAHFCFDASSGTVRLSINGSPYVNWSNPASGPGTVSSVGLSSILGLTSVTGSPVTTAGILTQSLTSQGAATVFAAPVGSVGTPSFQLLAAGHIPALDTSKLTTGILGTTRGGTGLGSYTQGSMLYASSTSVLAQTSPYVGVAKRYLMFSGDGTTPNAPTPTQVAFGDLSGTAAITQGGTGQTALGTTNAVLGVNGAGSATEWKGFVAGSNVSITHGANAITISTTGTLAASATSLFDTDTIINREAANTWRVIGNTPGSAQRFFIYRTSPTNAAGTAPGTNYSRFAIDSSGTNFRLYAEDSGTGSTPQIFMGVNANGLNIDGNGLVTAAGTGAIQAAQFVGTGSTTSAVDLATAEVSGTLPNAKTTAATTATANTIVVRDASADITANDINGRYVAAKHYNSTAAAAPTCTVGTAPIAGTGAACNVVGSDAFGYVTFTSGTSISAFGAALFTVNFNAPYFSQPACTYSPANLASAQLVDANMGGAEVWINTNANGWWLTISGANAQPSRSYIYSYVCGGF